jgi:hypothetical protein
VIDILIKLSATSTMTSKHACALIRGKKILATGINQSVPMANIVNTAIQIQPLRRTGYPREPKDSSDGVSHFRCQKDQRITTKYPTLWGDIITSC